MPQPYVSFNISFSGGVQPTAHSQPFYVEIRQPEFGHEISILRLNNEPWMDDRFLSGMPIALNYGYQGGDMDTWYGYINHIDHKFERVQQTTHMKNWTEIVCVGTSWPMKQPGFGVYPDDSAIDVIEKVAAQFYLSTDTQFSDQVWSSFTHAGESYWKFLQKVASKIGYTLFVNKATINSFSRSQAVSRFLDQLCVAVYTTNPMNVLHFHPHHGSEVPREHRLRRRHTWNYDHITGQVQELIVDPDSLPPTGLGQIRPRVIFDSWETDISEQTFDETSSALTGRTLQNEFPLRAEAEVWGNVAHKQGTSVYFDSAFGQQQSGYWYVHEAHHVFNLGYNNIGTTDARLMYKVKLKLGRDSYGISATPPQLTGGQACLPLSLRPRKGEQLKLPPTTRNPGGGGSGTGTTTIERPRQDDGQQVKKPPVVLVPNPETGLGQWRSSYKGNRCRQF